MSFVWLGCSWYSSALMRSIGSGLADMVAAHVCVCCEWRECVGERNVRAKSHTHTMCLLKKPLDGGTPPTSIGHDAIDSLGYDLQEERR